MTVLLKRLQIVMQEHTEEERSVSTDGLIWKNVNYAQRIPTVLVDQRGVQIVLKECLRMMKE